MTQEEFLNITYTIEGEPYTIGEMMEEMKNASTSTEAFFWHHHLTQAVLPLNQMANAILMKANEVMKKRIPPTSAVAAIKGGTEAPPQLSPNIIFVGDQGDYIIDMVELWKWIDYYFVPRMQYSYDWLALLLFAKHYSLLLKDDSKSFAQQMSSWFPNVSHPCTQDEINLYRRGYFKSDNFNYRTWKDSPYPVPSDYVFKKSQHKEGFGNIQSICIALEGAYDLGEIATQNVNK